MTEDEDDPDKILSPCTEADVKPEEKFISERADTDLPTVV